MKYSLVCASTVVVFTVLLKVSVAETEKAFPTEAGGTITVKLKKALSWMVTSLLNGLNTSPNEDGVRLKKPTEYTKNQSPSSLHAPILIRKFNHHHNHNNNYRSHTQYCCHI